MTTATGCLSTCSQ